MRTIKTTTGAELPLDGDLLTVIETLYREVTARRQLERSFEDIAKEIAHLNGRSISFMAKYDFADTGSSCHVHSSLWSLDGSTALTAAHG